MEFFKIALALFIGVSLLAGCASPAAPASSTTSSSGAYTNPSQRITIPVGVSFKITVSSNPTTGYQWEAGFDQSLLKLVKRYTSSGSGAIGAGGDETFEFEGMRKGETEIYLNYKRSFEPNNPSLTSKTFKVTIQ